MDHPALFDPGYAFKHHKHPTRSIRPILTDRDKYLLELLLTRYRLLPSNWLHALISLRFPTSQTAFYRISRKLFRTQ